MEFRTNKKGKHYPLKGGRGVRSGQMGSNNKTRISPSRYARRKLPRDEDTGDLSKSQVRALHKFLDDDGREDVGIREVRNGNTTQNEYGSTIEFTDGSEYYWFANSDDAEKSAFEYVKGMLEDEPEMFNQDWLQYQIDEKHLRDQLEPDERDRIEEDVDGSPEQYDLTDEDAENRTKAFEEKVEELLNERLDDPVQYLKDIYGEEDGLEEAMKIGGIDESEAAKAALRDDGIAHFLAGYDGEEVELESGAVMYRHN